MRSLRIGAAAINQTPLDWTGNIKRIVACLDRARLQDIAVLCLPELCVSGYGCEDAFLSPHVWRQSLAALDEISPCTRGIIAAVGLPIAYQNQVYSAVALLVDGKVRGIVAKQHLAGDGVHYEPRWFSPWSPGRVVELQLSGGTCPFGDLVFDIDGLLVGFEICEDAWVAQRPAARLSHVGCDVVLNPSASHFAFDKAAVRERIAIEASRFLGATYVYVNLLGNEAGRMIYDGDAYIATSGILVARGRRLSFQDFQLTSAVVDIERARSVQASRSRDGIGTDRAAPQLVPVSYAVQEAAWRLEKPVYQPWEIGEHAKHEAFVRVVALGLFDYLRKSRSHGFVISLSGGCDSAVVAVLCGFMVHLAIKELGEIEFAQRLGHIPNLDRLHGAESTIAHLLTCVYQATENSSELTRQAAMNVAESLGATYHELKIDTLVAGYVERIGAALGRRLTWKDDDVALQNIQARVRAPSVWLLANVKQALLLATSNRSEVAVGYATMDGDTCGSLSPIAGVDKFYLRGFLRWVEHQGPDTIGAIAAVNAVNIQAPTAELRPREAHQTDEEDLMPYDVLNALEELHVVARQSPTEAYLTMRSMYPDKSGDQIREWITRFYRLWSRNQWKRERYAPAFHLDDRNLDPRSWCRFPILSGGYECELAALQDRLAGRTPKLV